MIIVLAGNIASGKSTIARYLQSYAHDRAAFRRAAFRFHLVGIDEYRAEGLQEHIMRFSLHLDTVGELNLGTKAVY